MFKLTSIISEYAHLFCVPVPHHHCAIFRTCHYVTVLVNVTLWPPDTRHNIKMTIDCLGCLGWNEKERQIIGKDVVQFGKFCTRMLIFIACVEIPCNYKAEPQGGGHSHWQQYAYARTPRVPFWPISVPQRVGFSSNVPVRVGFWTPNLCQRGYGFSSFCARESVKCKKLH